MQTSFSQSEEVFYRSHITIMLDGHSPSEDMFLHFCRQMVQICPHLCCFLSILKTTPNNSSLASFYSSRRKCTECLGASLYALITFRATSNAIQGRILKFLSGCGEGGPSLCRMSTWGYPLPKITRTLSPRYVTWIMHKRIMFAYTLSGHNWVPKSAYKKLTKNIV